jgi:hypothetical protein
MCAAARLDEMEAAVGRDCRGATTSSPAADAEAEAPAAGWAGGVLIAEGGVELKI